MSSFAIELSSEDAFETLSGVESFVGVDESGSFGILARHEPLVTALDWGLCRFRLADGTIYYLGLPGGILSFAAGVLKIATPHYVRERDGATVLDRLSARMRAEEADRRDLRQLLRKLDQELLRRMIRA
jgi:F-type H+-transporting ATPase subunit epsilon